MHLRGRPDMMGRGRGGRGDRGNRGGDRGRGNFRGNDF
jgi:hypothetical protein